MGIDWPRFGGPPVRPFAEDGRAGGEPYARPYRYVDMARLAGTVETDGDTLKRARAMAERGAKAWQVRRLPGPSGETLWQALAVIGQGASGSVYVSVLFDRMRIVQLACQNPLCAGRNRVRGRKGDRVCVHALAALLLLADWLEKEGRDADATDEGGRALLSAFGGAGRPGGQGAPSGGVLRLEPQLVFSWRDGGAELGLGLRAGCGRLCKVQDLRAFVRAEETAGSCALSRSETADFGADRIAEEDGALDSILRGAVGERENLLRELGRETGRTYSAKLSHAPLSGSRLDAFFDAYEGKRVPCRGMDAGEVLLTGGGFRPALRLSPLRSGAGELDGVLLEGELPPLFSGARAQYLADRENGRFLRLPEAQSAFLRRLSAGADGGKLSIRIGRRTLRDFYRNVLPALREGADLSDEAGDEAGQYVPPEPAFIFLLDADGARLFCRAEAAYGERRGPLMRSWQDGAGMYRDMDAESAAMDAVRRFFPLPDGEKGCQSCTRTDDAVWDFFETGLDSLAALGEVRATDAFRALRVRTKWRVAAGVSLRNDLLRLSVSSPDIPEDELSEVLRSLTAKKRYHRLKSGTLLGLQGESAEALEALYQGSGVPLSEFVAGKMDVPAYRALYLDQLLAQQRGVDAERDAGFRGLVRRMQTWNEAEFEVPETLRGVLRAYQREGFRWLMTLSASGFGGILADDMGLGKTLQMIAVLLYERARRESFSALVVCPSSLVYNWLAEIRRFAPALRAAAVAGTPRERARVLRDRDACDVFVTSYDLVRRDAARYEGLSFDVMVLDEAQFVKNHASAASKAVRVISSARRFALTGTPVENRLSELWSLFDFIMPGFLFRYETFRRTFETPIVRGEDAEAAARLRRLVGPFVLRRTKAEVLSDLPEKTEEVRYAVLEGEQRRVYDAHALRLRKSIEAGGAEAFEKSRIRILAELTRLREVCCDPALLYEDYRGASAKREALWELLESAWDGGHRVLVFSQFTGFLALVEEDLKTRGVSYEKLTGDTPKQERLLMVQRFNEGDAPVFLISLKAGGTGLNLTGADIVVLLDPWWNAAAEAQAEDRAHRIGQTRPVSVYRVIAKDTVEERILELQERKRALAEDVLSESAQGAGALDREALLALLSDREGQ